MLNLIIEPMCFNCKENKQKTLGLCSNCLNDLNEINKTNRCKICSHPIKGKGNICERCFKAKDNFDMGFFLFSYKNSGKSLIHNLKFKDKLHFLKILENENPVLDDFLINIDCITYIPSSYLTFARRGYNLSFEIAKKVSEIHKIPVIKLFKANFFYKKRLAMSKNKSERKKIVGKFLKLKDSKNHFENILIVDDVFTTGTTLNKASFLLKKEKIGENCKVFTLARVLGK